MAVLGGTEHSPRSLDRVVFIADAVFALAITLLVVEITVTAVAKSELRHALGDQGWEFFTSACGSSTTARSQPHRARERASPTR